MAIEPDEYETMRAWSSVMIEHVMPISPHSPPEAHPITCLDEMARVSPSRARQGLAMMIGDLIEASQDVSGQNLLELDRALDEADLPTLSDMRLRFGRQMRRILEAGVIKSETDYYAVRNAVEGVSNEAERSRLWDLLADYEARVTNGS